MVKSQVCRIFRPTGLNIRLCWIRLRQQDDSAGRVNYADWAAAVAAVRKSHQRLSPVTILRQDAETVGYAISNGFEERSRIHALIARSAITLSMRGVRSTKHADN